MRVGTIDCHQTISQIHRVEGQKLSTHRNLPKRFPNDVTRLRVELKERQQDDRRRRVDHTRLNDDPHDRRVVRALFLGGGRHMRRYRRGVRPDTERNEARRHDLRRDRQGP